MLHTSDKCYDATGVSISDGPRHGCALFGTAGLAENPFDLLKFYAITANLDLMVDTPKVSKTAVWVLLDYVAGSIPDRVAASGQVNKLLCAPLGVVPIPGCYLRSRDT